MRIVAVSLSVTLVLTSLLPVNGLAQNAATDPGYNAVKQTDKIALLREQEDDFVRHFVQLPSQQRVALWKRSSSSSNYVRSTVEWRTRGEMRAAFILQGVDAIPFLSDIVRHGDLTHRIEALEILCEMDRFVPIADLPIPVSPSVYVRALKQGGRINPFQPVDGRRIGLAGYQAVEWAATQKEDKELKFHARALSGSLKSDLAALAQSEQFRIWREAVLKSRGTKPSNWDASITRSVLEDILMEKTPESLAGFRKVLVEERDSSIVGAAIANLRRADICRSRLRGSQNGLEAIDSIRSALQRPNNSGPTGATEAQTNDKLWKTLSAQFFDDKIRLDPTSTWAVYVQAFEVLYKQKLAGAPNSFVGRGPAAPETLQFVTYLTKLDPGFPSWEYSYCPNDGQAVADEVMHPQFKTKIKRYFEAWTQFESRDPKRRSAP